MNAPGSTVAPLLALASPGWLWLLAPVAVLVVLYLLAQRRRTTYAVRFATLPMLERLVPKAYREFYPGKDDCADGYFYLHDGTAWSFYKGGFLDD